MSLELKSLTRETEILRSRTFFTRVENKVKAFLTNLILCFFSIHTVVMANLCSMPLHLNIMREYINDAKVHYKTVINPMICVMNDAKVQLREKAAAAMSSWLEIVPIKFWFDNESISEVLGDAKKVNMKTTFLTWLSDKLKDQKKVPRIGLEAC